jgi:FkbM family methyltransferase
MANNTTSRYLANPKRTPKRSLQKAVARFLEALARSSVAVSNLGLFSTLILYYHRLLKPTGIFSIRIKKLAKRFYFRGNIDWGVMTHFYKPGYRIVDDVSDEKINLIIDAGANIGIETLRFRFFHPNARIICIEAEKSNFELLERNVSNDTKLTLINAGLYNKNCKLKIYNGGTSNESFKIIEVTADDTNYDVLGMSMLDIIKNNYVPEIDILKLDIEGAEKWVFDETADNWICKVKVLIFECPDADAPGTTSQIYDVLRRNQLRFNTFIHGENLVLIRNDVHWKLVTDLFFE